MTRVLVRLAPMLAIGTALVMTWAWIAHQVTTAFAAVR